MYQHQYTSEMWHSYMTVGQLRIIYVMYNICRTRKCGILIHQYTFREVPKCLKHPAGPGQKLIHGGQYEWRKYNCNFLVYSSHILNMFCHNLNTKVCAIEALTTWLMCCLCLVRLSCLPFPLLQRIKLLVLWTIPYRIERMRNTPYRRNLSLLIQENESPEGSSGRGVGGRLKKSTKNGPGGWPRREVGAWGRVPFSRI